MRIRTLVAAEVSRSLLELLRNDDRFDVDYRPLADEESLAAAVNPFELLVTRHYNRVTARVLEAATNLRVIAQGTSGLDNIDLAVAEKRKVAILDAAGENANAVAELVIAQMITLTRTVPLYQQQLLSGRWERADCDTRHELRFHRLGIVGIGRVGSRVAKLAAAFGVQSLAFDPYLDATEVSSRGATKVDTLEELLGAANILTLHVPLTDQTRGMIGRAQLEQLKRGSVVINASRGEVLDLDALLELLRDQHLLGAALDVYDPEPPKLPSNLPLDRLLITPHIAGCSFESKASIGEVIYRKLCRFYELEPRLQ